jgi:protein-S-isoprenylcysteine O-methyltransferase Ste14
MNKKTSSHTVDKKKAWVFVTIQAILLAMLILLGPQTAMQIYSHSTIGMLLKLTGFVGIIVSSVFIRLSLTALPIPTEKARLSTSGLYKYVRHPMYTSVLLLSLGIAIDRGTIVHYLLVICLYALFYYKSIFEEQNLAARFEEYPEYARKTPRFIPFTIR